MRNVLIVITVALIVWFVCRCRKYRMKESFVLDVPDSVDIETVSSDILGSYKVYKSSAMDHDGIISK